MHLELKEELPQKKNPQRGGEPRQTQLLRTVDMGKVSKIKHRIKRQAVTLRCSSLLIQAQSLEQMSNPRSFCGGLRQRIPELQPERRDNASLTTCACKRHVFQSLCAPLLPPPPLDFLASLCRVGFVSSPSIQRQVTRSVLLALARLLGVAAYDLDLVRRDGVAAAVHLKGDVLDQEGPNLVAEPIGIEAAL